MWRSISVLDNKDLRDFENHFDFRIGEPMRGYILEHNGGMPVSGIFHTAVRERQLACLLNFADRKSPKGAWAINERLRKLLTDQRIVIGIDTKENFVCLERHYKHQKIVVWSHITGAFEDSLLDIPSFIRAID